MRPSLSLLYTGLVSVFLAALAPGAVAQPLPETVEEGRAPLSSSEVSDQEISSAAVILVALEQHRKEVQKKYGNPEGLEESKRRQVQQKVVKERQEIMQRKMVEEDLDAGRMELIMISARRDSVLNDRVHAALDKRRQNVKNLHTSESNRAGE